MSSDLRRTWRLAAVLAAGLAAAVGPTALAAPQSARPISYGPGDTGVVRVSTDAGFAEGEEPLSVNPRNPDQLLTVANVFHPTLPGPASSYVGGGGIDDSRLYASQDGGRHWKTFKLDQGGLGPVAGFSDAVNIVNTDSDVVWDRHGNAYFESGDIHGLNHGGSEVATVWRSTDGGRTWGPKNGYTAVNATTEERTELDRPWFAADNSGGPHDGRIYMTFETTPFANIPPQVYVKHSDDHGATWSPTVRVDDGIYETQWNPRARPVIGADGSVNVIYDRGPVEATPFVAYDGPIDLVLARSTDGGQTFARTVVDADVRRVTSPDEATSAYTEMIAAIAADPGDGKRVAVAWPQAFGANSSRILLRYTTDGGAHWSSRVDVADDSVKKSNQHDHVTLSWLDDGRLFVGWRDRRCCGGGWAGDYQQWVRAVRLSSRSAELGRVVEFTHGPQPVASAGRGQLQPDEFQGLVATRAGVGLTWSQLGSDGWADLMFRRIPLTAFTQ
jgi:hypothetical protein